VMVNYATADGTAVAGSDYVATSGTLTFAPGTTTQNITVLVNGDVVAEPNETFFVNLSSPVNATIADAQGVGTILNDDAPAITIADRAMAEGTGGTTPMPFTVTLSVPTTSTVAVAYATAPGTATGGGVDYFDASGTVTFNPGVTSQTITVTLNADALPEPNETFFVNLSSPTNATIARAQAVGTIIDDDSPLTFFTLTPCRLLDTRNPNGPSGGPALAANANRNFPTLGLCGIPSDAKAIAIIATTVSQTDFGDLRLYPADALLPAASTINFAVNHVRANNAIVPLGTAGQVGVQCDMPPGSTGTTHFLMDVFGYFK
jgi:Calx-beta domain-containing protein